MGARGRPLLSLALALAALGAGPAPAPSPAPKDPPPAPAAEIRGVVTGPGGRPLARATVMIAAVQPDQGGSRRPRSAAPTSKPQLVATGPDGSFLAKDLVGRSFAVRVVADGMAPFTAKEIPAGASVRVNLKPGLTLRGRVLDRASRAPIGGATVEAADPDSAPFGRAAVRKATADEQGAFEFRDLAPGTVSLAAFAPAHSRATLARVPVPTPAGRDGAPGPEPLLMLGPGGRLSGRVTLPGGQPAPDVSVRLEPKVIELRSRLEERDVFETLTDAAGRFVLEGLPAGNEYALRARKEGHPPAERGPYRIEAGTDVSDIEIRLESGAALRLRLADADGRPVDSARFWLDSSDGRALGGGPIGSNRAISDEQVETGPEGLFTVRALPAGRFDLRIEPEDYDEIERAGIELRAGETTELGAIVVRATRGISGRVADRAGEPIAGAEVGAVYAAPGGGQVRSRTARTKPDGRWRITGIGEGRILHLWAWARGYGRAIREDVTGATDEPLDFALDRTGSILGRAQLAEGGFPRVFTVRAEREAEPAPGSGGRGLWFRMTTHPGERSFTDPGGYFRLEDVEPGSHTVVVEAEGRVPARKSGVAVAAGADADIGTVILEAGRRLEGRVLDGRDDSPVAGAAVHALPPEGRGFMFGPRATGGSAASSGPDGSFVLEGLEAGAYVVAVSHGEFAPSETRVEIPAEGRPPEVVVRLGRGGRLEGTVRDAARQPVAGERIALMQGPFRMGDARFVETGADGRYAFERLAPGGYAVYRTGRGPALALAGGMLSKTVTIREGETTVLDFGEEPKVRLSGRVLRGSKPVPQAAILFSRSELSAPDGVVATSSDENGAYSVGLESGGSYNVLVRPRDATGTVTGGAAAVRVTVPEAPEAQADILLPAHGISGRVLDESGKPFAGAFVTAVREGASPSDPSGRAFAAADAAGAYAIEGLAPGTYRLTATAPGYRVAEAYPVVVQEGPTPPVDFTLEPGRTLRGKVVDPQGRAVANAFVFAAPAGGAAGAAAPAATTDVNGAFSIAAPSEGPVDVTAIAAGWAPARLSALSVTGDPEEPPVVLAVSAGGSVRVQVLGPQGEPVAQVPVTVRASPPFPGSEMLPFLNPVQPTGPDGATVVRHLAPGTYEVVAPGKPDAAPVHVTVTEGGEATATIRIR